jgi:MFS family permease
MSNPNKGRRYALLTILLLILAYNYVDRLAFGLVMQDIKTDLSLSDTQLGILNGIAFALFYSVMGIPIARWADRGDRVKIISACVGIWSAMVAVCGMATSFAQLLLARVGVSIGEAGCVPPGHSLISDYFSRMERPRAFALYMLGAPLSNLLGYLAAGLLNESFGWRFMFFILAAPGLALTLLSWFALREPRRGRGGKVQKPSNQTANEPGEVPALGAVLKTLATKSSFRNLLLCFSVAFFFAFGLAQWLPTFFVRSYGLETGELGIWFTLVYGVGGLIGTVAGGELASRYAAHQECRQLKAIALIYFGLGLIFPIIFFTANMYVAFALLALTTIVGSLTSAPLFATIQTLMPARMRAQAIAFVYLFANLIGMGLGPLVTGMLSDGLHARFGSESLRYALLALSPGYIWAAWHVWRASKTVMTELEQEQTVADSLRMHL